VRGRQAGAHAGGNGEWEEGGGVAARADAGVGVDADAPSPPFFSSPQDVKHVAWHPHGHLLASASYDGDARTWRDAGDGDWDADTTLPSAHAGETVWSVAWRPGDGGALATAGGDGGVRVWVRAEEKKGGGDGGDWRLAAAAVGGHGGRPAFDLDWGEAGIASCGGDDAVRVWGVAESEGGGAGEATRLPLVAAASPSPPCEVNCVRWCPTDPGLLAAACDDGAVRLWRLGGRVAGGG